MGHRVGHGGIGRRDLAEGAIVEVLRAAGCSVEQISKKGVPDLLVGFTANTPDGREIPFNMLMEVKTGKSGLTKDEKVFFEDWNGQRVVVRTPEEALEALYSYTDLVSIIGGYHD